MVVVLVVVVVVIVITTNFGLQIVKILPPNSIPCQSISNKDRHPELFFPCLFSSRISGLFYAALYWIYRWQSCADENILVFSSPFPQFYFPSFSGRRYIVEFQLHLAGFHSLSIMPQASIVIKKMEENLYRGRWQKLPIPNTGRASMDFKLENCWTT